MSRKPRATQWRDLSLALTAIAVVWGLVLPRLEQTATVQARLKHFDKHGIDPAAFFYTDHDGMHHWEAGIHKAQRRNPAAFW